MFKFISSTILNGFITVNYEILFSLVFLYCTNTPKHQNGVPL